MKDTFYFSHDYNSRSDDKIKMLIRKHGMLGYGLFWAIVEDLYNNANAMRTDYEGIAYELRTDTEIIKSIINDFELFTIKDNYFCSLSVQRRLDERDAKSIKAKESAFKRWNKDANALQSQTESNAIKERKVKEKKEKNIDMSFVEDDFKKPFELFLEYKKERKEIYKSEKTLHASYNNLKLLSNNNPLIAEKIVNQSIANNWAGLFPLKVQPVANKPKYDFIQ